jgi:hypothetical protein
VRSQRVNTQGFTRVHRYRWRCTTRWRRRRRANIATVVAVARARSSSGRRRRASGRSRRTRRRTTCSQCGLGGIGWLGTDARTGFVGHCRCRRRLARVDLAPCRVGWWRRERTDRMKLESSLVLAAAVTVVRVIDGGLVIQTRTLRRRQRAARARTAR